MNTSGYKRRYNTFSKTLKDQGIITGQAYDEESDSKPIFDFSQGRIIETGRTLDLALGGKGFFVIETPDGQLYTRNGSFRLNNDLQIVDMSGQIVLGDSGPITIPPNVSVLDINVSKDGNVTGGDFPIGKLKLVDFKPEDENGLVPVGKSCFKAPEDAKTIEPTELTVQQKFLESSNVEMVEELVDMIMVTRLYEANMKFVSVNRDSSKSIIGVAMS